MGYTHYWYVNPKANKENYKKALEAIDKIVEYGSNVGILAGPTGKGLPRTTPHISFNGVGDEDSYETFLLHRKPLDILKESFVDKDEDGFVFSCCKTAYNKYDFYVVACLATLKHFLKDDVKISSDGGPREWRKGLLLASHVLQLEIESPLKRKD